MSPVVSGKIDNITVRKKPATIDSSRLMGRIDKPASRAIKLGPNVAPNAIHAERTRLNIFSGNKMVIRTAAMARKIIVQRDTSKIVFGLPSAIPKS